MNKFLRNSVQCLVHVWVALILLSEEFIFVWKPKTFKLEHQSCVNVSETGCRGYEEGVKQKQTIWSSYVVWQPQVAIQRGVWVLTRLLCQWNHRFQEWWRCHRCYWIRISVEFLRWLFEIKFTIATVFAKSKLHWSFMV